MKTFSPLAVPVMSVVSRTRSSVCFGPDKRERHTTPVGNVKIALPESIPLLLHQHVNGPWSLVVT